MSANRLLVIIPCYNEEASIANLITELNNCNYGYDVIVIDDGSSDNTFHVSQKISRVIRLPRNLGIGGAVQTGIKYAQANNYNLCVQLDGDGQHPPSEIAQLLNAYKLLPRSIIIGSRYLKYDTFRSTFMRRIGGKSISLLINKLFPPCSIIDVTSGLRLMDRQAINFFANHYPHDFPEPISLVLGLKAGLTFGEIPVRMRARKYGASTIHGLKPFFYMVRVVGYIILARFTQTPSLD